MLNIVLAFALVGAYDILGLAAALAISYVVCALWALQVMAYKVPSFPLRAVMGSLWKMVVAAAIAGELTWLVTDRFGATSGGGGVGAARRRARSSAWPPTSGCWRRSRRPS